MLQMIVEVRHQFLDIPGLLERAPGVRPEQVHCIDITTRSYVLEMVLPGMLTIMTPLIVEFGFGQKGTSRPVVGCYHIRVHDGLSDEQCRWGLVQCQ